MLQVYLMDVILAFGHRGQKLSLADIHFQAFLLEAVLSELQFEFQFF